MRGRVLLFVVLVGTLAVAAGAAGRASESSGTDHGVSVGIGRDVADAFVPLTITRAQEVAPRELDFRLEVAAWVAFCCALASIGSWFVVREARDRGARARGESMRRTRAPPLMPSAICC